MKTSSPERKQLIGLGISRVLLVFLAPLFIWILLEALFKWKYLGKFGVPTQFALIIEPAGKQIGVNIPFSVNVQEYYFKKKQKVVI